VTAPEEQRLLEGLRAGRSEACAELVRGHYQAVYRLLLHLTRDGHRAEDLTQETFAKAWRVIDSFQGKASLGTWLHRIAYTKFLDAQRTRQRDDATRERLVRPHAGSVDPFDAAAADDESRQLHQALAALEPPERVVLVLHYLQDLSYAEMAVVLEEPVGTVKWRTHAALGRLRELLPDEMKEHAISARTES
jgi:RNA polymerase sigma-70 factor, ECF subfamily